jgi:glycosyltransferase involved in cell wall biosynthesis
LKSRFKKEIDLPKGRLIVVISHSDYLNSMGGTEKKISEQIEEYTNQGIHAICIFPAFRNEFMESKESEYGIRIDGKMQGYFDLKCILLAVSGHVSDIDEVLIHHLMYWTSIDINILIRFMKKYSIRYNVYMHDFYFFSPAIYAIYVGKVKEQKDIYRVNEEFHFIDEYTEAKTRLQWKEFYYQILKDAQKIVLPSVFIKESVQKYFEDLSEKLVVKGHLILTQQKLEKRHNDKLRIAYLGYSAEFKGWSTWERVIQYLTRNNHYDFYHIGGLNQSDKYVTNIPYSFQDGGVNAAVEKLIENNIDIVVLWSIIPESYSYTLFEAIAASSYILTNTLSGNICHTIRGLGEGYGRIFINENEMLDYLKDVDKVKSDINNKNQSTYLLSTNT